MKLVFMGTPEFAAPVLSALLDAGHNVVGVYTQPDRPSGRGNKTAPSPVKQLALDCGLPVFQPESLKPQEVKDEMAALAPEALIVAAYGLFLPRATLEMAPLGALNIHPSMLPKYRGPSPITTALLNGDRRTGVTIMKLDSGMDTGPIIAQREVEIRPDETAPELTERLFRLGAVLLTEVLALWEAGVLHAEPQDDSQAIVTRLLTKEDGEIDWGQDADRIARQVRAYQPWPGSYTHWDGKLIKVLEAEAAGPAAAAPPGTVAQIHGGELVIAAGAGVLVVRRLQIEGKKPATAREFTQGYPSFVGARVGRKVG
ncbi:MAG: methionyl-tRNA formyltransferase [SAR202 cluster bacterium]|nr:methionyl-tRNA formyltransferase [SAR202 cluster bacterium]